MIDNVTINNNQINLIPQETNVDIIKLQNQKAIECLKEVKEFVSTNICYCIIEEDYKGKDITEFIDNKIKELEVEE